MYHYANYGLWGKDDLTPWGSMEMLTHSAVERNNRIGRHSESMNEVVIEELGELNAVRRCEWQRNPSQGCF
jgi:hypothetical protein